MNRILVKVLHIKIFVFFLFLIDVLKSTAEEVKAIKGKLLRDVDGLDNALKNLMSGGTIYLLSLSLSLLF